MEPFLFSIVCGVPVTQSFYAKPWRGPLALVTLLFEHNWSLVLDLEFSVSLIHVSFFGEDQRCKEKTIGEKNHRKRWSSPSRPLKSFMKLLLVDSLWVVGVQQVVVLLYVLFMIMVHVNTIYALGWEQEGLGGVWGISI